ncbi:MAG: glycoside hydrolase family 10 [Planctomycetaceae bacterium]|nr:glycoside hydrolase family 10 [Planctomycetaceae bacterium]
MQNPNRVASRPAVAVATIALACLWPGYNLRAEIPDSYRTRWRDPAVVQRIERNIEAHRKGDATITVVDANNRPVAGAEVALQQTTHAFLFGCNAFVLGQLEPAEVEQRYEEAFAHLFNFATVPFYWAGTEPTRGELRYAEPAQDIWRRPPPDRFLSWAARYGIALKGHPLLWHAHNPPWLPQDPDALRQLYQKRFEEIAARYADRIGIWDVVNESLVCPQSYPLFTPDRSYVQWAFQQVAPLFPDQTTLMINEVANFNFPPASERYFTQIQQLMAAGTPIRGIGFQYHYFRREALDSHLANPSCDPNTLLDVYEQFASFQVPLYITEITIPSAGDGGEQLQAEVVRDHYRLWFSAPTMAGITWWNLGDGTAMQGENEAQGGLLDADLKPKPAYTALDQLINQEWMTRLATRTDEHGALHFRGFYGKYTVQVTAEGETEEYTIELARGGPATHQLVWKTPPSER